jgi:putative ABC transport system permease protein
MFPNLQYSVRMLWKNPSFSIVAVITLALGIGANATIFSFVNGLLFRPISGVERPDRLVAIFTSDYSSGTYGRSSYPDYLDFQQQSNVFTDLALYDNDSFTLSGANNAEEVKTAVVTSNYFQVLGVGAQLGRTFRTQDNEESAVVLSAAFWKRHFGSDASVVGRAITFNDRPYTVIGVAAESFHGLRFGWQPEIWVPMSAKLKDSGRGNRSFGITGRLRDGVSLQQAQAQITTIADRLAHEYPETNMGTLAQPHSPRPVSVVPEARIVADGNNGIRFITVLLFVVVGIVLLIACANVANLFLARASSRRPEFAIRLALGASRWQLIRQLLTESILLALLGGVAGLVIAFWTASLIPTLFSRNEITDLDLSADWRVLLFTGAVSIFTGILFGITPAIQASNPQLISTLKDEQSAPIFGRRRLGFRGLLVTAQVALSVLLLVAAGLFLRSLHNAVTFNPGFENRNLLIAPLTVGRNLTKPQLANFSQEVTDNMSAEPGVRSVSLTKVEPLSGGGQRRNVVIEGYQPRPNEDTELNTNVVGLNFFNTMGIPIVGGRDFNSGDREGTGGVVVVNEEFAQRYFPNGSPLGKHVRVDSEGPFLEIVGVVRTAKHRDLRELPLPIVYLPLAQEMQGDMTLLVRTVGEPASLRDNIRSVVQRINRNVPIASIKTINEQINEALAPDRTMALLLAIFGAAALLLASVGIYGVVAYAVSQRTHEIGIRMALGARSADVLRLVVRDGMTMAVVGVAIGLAGAFAITRVIGSLLFGVTPTDLFTFLIVTLGLLSVALVASYVPARRATKVDPLEALRYE